jgi:hypothetical protein
MRVKKKSLLKFLVQAEGVSNLPSQYDSPKKQKNHTVSEEIFSLFYKHCFISPKKVYCCRLLQGYREVSSPQPLLNTILVSEAKTAIVAFPTTFFFYADAVPNT